MQRPTIETNERKTILSYVRERCTITVTYDGDLGDVVSHIHMDGDCWRVVSDDEYYELVADELDDEPEDHDTAELIASEYAMTYEDASAHCDKTVTDIITDAKNRIKALLFIVQL